MTEARGVIDEYRLEIVEAEEDAMGIRRWVSRIGRHSRTADCPQLPEPSITIPAEVRERLSSDNAADPLLPRLRRFGQGQPGVTHEEAEWWIVRDPRGQVVGGVRVGDVGPEHPPALDVAVDPRRLRQGFGSMLYLALEEAGIDVEAASAASLAHRTMTPLGYAFMLGRRRRSSPHAEADVVSTVDHCPACGRLP